MVCQECVEEDTTAFSEDQQRLIANVKMGRNKHDTKGG